MDNISQQCSIYKLCWICNNFLCIDRLQSNNSYFSYLNKCVIIIYIRKYWEYRNLYKVLELFNIMLEINNKKLGKINKGGKR